MRIALLPPTPSKNTVVLRKRLYIYAYIVPRKEGRSWSHRKWFPSLRSARRGTGSMSICDSTIASNSSNFLACGVYHLTGDLTIIDSTISGNSAGSSPGDGGNDRGHDRQRLSQADRGSSFGVDGSAQGVSGYEKLPEKLDAYDYLIAVHYRHYLFYSNGLVAMIRSYLINRLMQTSPLRGFGTDLGVFVLCAVLLAGSRDILKKYRVKLSRVLG